MADILSGFGNDTRQPQMARSSNGGKQTPKPLPYSPPKGPSSQTRKGPGLGGTVHPCGSQRGK